MEVYFLTCTLLSHDQSLTHGQNPRGNMLGVTVPMPVFSWDGKDCECQYRLFLTTDFTIFKSTYRLHQRSGP